MDYSALARFHVEHQADITVAVQPVPVDEASRFGLLKRNDDYRISNFVEKPRDPDVLAEFVSRDEPQRPYLGSMGIYLFNTQALINTLEGNDYQDFGGQIIPNALQSHQVYGFDFDGYWEDIGTIRSFYETNLRMARPDSPFNFYDMESRIYTHARFLPGSVIAGATLHNVLLTEGCRILNADIRDSVVGLRSRISGGVRMARTIMMGADYYEPEGQPRRGGLPLGIGPDCDIEGAILDKNVRIGEGVVIKPFPPGTEFEEANWVVQDGIVVVPKSTVLYPGTHIGPE
jgi:glucose-1-phosphate adenylyltransferase